MASPSTINDPSWYVDSSATDHLTSNLNNLSIHCDYKGKAKITVGNGSSFSISHISDYVISSNKFALLVNKILHFMLLKFVKTYLAFQSLQSKTRS